MELVEPDTLTHHAECRRTISVGARSRELGDLERGTPIHLRFSGRTDR
jgi:hypothetical protein